MNATSNAKLHPVDSENSFHHYFIVYNVLSFASCVFLVFVNVAMVAAMIKCSNHFHDRLTNRVVFYPMSFFDTNPLGRVINRFSGDIQVLQFTFLSLVCNTKKPENAKRHQEVSGTLALLLLCGEVSKGSRAAAPTGDKVL